VVVKAKLYEKEKKDRGNKNGASGLKAGALYNAISDT
jgi:hypothetical protein